MRQDQMSGGISVLCRLAASVAMLYDNITKFGMKVKIDNNVLFGNKFTNLCTVWYIEGAIVYGHVPECHVTFEIGRLQNVWCDPHIDHKTSWRFQTSSDISLSEELIWKSRRPKNTTFIRGASPGIPYELWDKNAINWRGWNIATQERNVCDMGVWIVTFVVKGNCADDRLSRSTRVNPSRRQTCCSTSCLWSQAQWDTSDPDYSQNLGYWLTIRHRYICMWSWTEMLTFSFQLRAKTVCIPLRMSTEICRLGEGHKLCSLECRLSVGKYFPRRPRKCCRLETLACYWFHLQCSSFSNLSIPLRDRVLRDLIPNICICDFHFCEYRSSRW